VKAVCRVAEDGERVGVIRRQHQAHGHIPRQHAGERHSRLCALDRRSDEEGLTALSGGIRPWRENWLGLGRGSLERKTKTQQEG
jgi:hypothetical protein